MKFVILEGAKNSSTIFLISKLKLGWVGTLSTNLLHEILIIILHSELDLKIRN